MNTVPRFEQLEDRIVLDADPVVTIDAPAVIDIGQQDVAVTLTFDNVGDQSGYVPYIDFVLPSTGADGDDGVTFDSASFLGLPITTTELVFNSAGLATHPLATDALGNPLVVSAGDFGAQPGDTLVVFELPYGSFSPGNPPVDIDVVLDFSPLADLSDDFNLTAVAGFAFGQDPLDNPTTDAPIRSAVTAPVVVDQTLFEVFKSSTIPEGEAANGPSYPYQYTFGVNVADGQELTNFSLTDTLPHNIVYLGGLTVTGGTPLPGIVEPAVGAVITNLNDIIQIDFANISGTVSVSFDFHIAETLSDDNSPVIAPGTGAPGSVTNVVDGSGDWVPLDPRDAPETITESASTTSEVAALNIQKSLALFADNNPGVPGNSPGDEFEFTLNIQVSDYFNIGNLVVEDLLGNGWEFVAGSAVFTTVEEVGGISTPQNFGGNLNVDLTNFNAPGANAGTTGLTFDLSQAMIDAGQDGLLTGDAARPGAISEVPTTVQITYRALIREAFSDQGGLGQTNIGQGDVIGNDVTVRGDVFDNATNTPTGSTLTDDSSAEISFERGEIREKTIVAVNGAAFDPNVPISAGDEITFSIIYDSPLGSFDDVTITDNLPQDVFDALEITNFYQPGSGPAVPPAGSATFGPADTFFANLAVPAVPTLAIDGPDNQIDFDLSNLNVDPRQPVVVEILLTVTVQDAIFSPELLLTNQSTVFETNTAQGTTTSTAIAQFTYSEPVLEISKGVVAFDPAPNSDVTLPTPGPVAFTDPGSTGARFSGLINSTNLDSTPINSNITGIDAGDTLTYAIVVENTGRAPNGAFDVTITDTLPAGMSLAGGTGNIFVTDGNGTPLAFTGNLFTTGITLTDPTPVSGPVSGAIAAFNATSGTNVVVVTYDVVVDTGTTPGAQFNNIASVTEFAAFEGGIDRVPDDNLTDGARATVDLPEISKTLTDRQFTSDGSITGRAADEVVVGEMVEFTIRVGIPEATYFDAIIRDRVTAGSLVLVSAEIDASPVAGQVGTMATVAGNQLTFNLGDFVNPADNDLTNDFIEITVQARVDDVAGINANALLRNVASFEYANSDGGPANILQGANSQRLTEPNLTLDKEAANDVVQAGETVSYTIDIDNIQGFRDAPAFDLTLTDSLPLPDLVLIPASIQLFVDGALVAFDGTNFDLTVTGNGFDVFIDRLDPNQTAQVRYTATVAQDVIASLQINNTATLVFDSTPEDDSGADGDDRDYSLSDQESITTRAPGISKDVDTSSTSYAETSGTDLGIGELVTYEIVVVVPEGETDFVVLSDTLPAGLEYVTSEIVRISDSLSRITGPNIGGGPLLGAGDEGVNVGQVTTFDFGTLTNAFDGVIDANDEIVVRITARLTADAGVDTTDRLTNTSTLRFENGQGNPQSVSDTADIDVVEPALALTKGVSPTTADAGETVSYTLLATNTGDGPAYDMIISDDVVGAAVSANQASVVITLRDGSGGIFTPTEAPSFSFDVNGALQVIIPTLPAGFSAEITYQAVVEDVATFSTAYVNTAEITRFDSNPLGDTVTGPGAPEEERVYGPGPQATATFTTPDVTLDKSFLSSSNPDTAAGSATANADLVVGETVTYLLSITIPEGQADLILTDVLPTGLQAVSAQVVSLDGATSTTLIAGATDLSDANITLAAGSVSFDFGTVSLFGTADGAATDTTITVSVTAQVTDTLPQVTDGATLTNTASLQVLNPADGTALQPNAVATETVDIVEPELVVNKNGPIGADPGDVVPYRITVTNTGSGPAYDAVISDPLADAFLSLVPGSIVVVQSSGAASAPGDITENSFAGDGFSIENLNLLPGQSVTVTFDVLVAPNAPDANSFRNTATVIFDTVPDGNPNSPTGRTGTDSDDHVIATVPRIEKTPFSSSFPETNSDAPTDTPFDLSVGEQVTYRYVITLPEIALDSVFVRDTLPTGFEYVSFSIGSTGDITGANLLTPTVDNSGAANVVSFDFGPLQNNNVVDGINANDEIVFFVTGVVTDDGANIAGADRTNTVTLDVDPAGPTAPFNQQATSADVRIVEPELEIDKTGPLAISPGGSGQFTIVVENSGPAVLPSATGPAYDVVISDVLDPQLTLTASSISVLLNGIAVTPDSLTTSAGGFSIGFDVLNPNDVVRITYNAVLDPAATSLDTFTNLATAAYDSAPGTPADPDLERSYAPVSDNHVISTIPELSKTPVSSSVALTGDAQNAAGIFDLAIGEEVTYALVLTLPDIPMDVVSLVDVLPAGLEFVSARVVSTSDDVAITGTTTITPGASNVTFTLTNVTNTTTGSDANQITLEVVSRVRDIIGNVDTVQLINQAGLTITPQGEAPLTTVNDTAVVEIVEPDLTVAKTSPVAVNPGDTVQYQLVITNNGTGPAYDLIVQDTLGNAFLSLDSGSVTIDLGGDITAQVNVTETASGFIFELDNNATGDPFPLPPGGTLIVTYSATLSAAAPEAQSFANNATVNYDSLPGDPVDLNGNPVDDRDYTATDDASVATVPFLVKTPTASTFAETSDTPFQLAIGETVTYTYQLFLPEIEMTEIVFFDDLPDGLRFASFSVVSTGDMTAIGGGAFPAPVVDLIGNDLQLTFLNVNNPSDLSIGADDVITITVNAVVISTADAGDTLTNEAVLQVTPAGGGNLNQSIATANVSVVEPELTVDKSGPLGANPGDVVPFEITITNTHPSGATGPAYDVNITDTIPPEFTLSASSLTFVSDLRGTLTPASLVSGASGFTAQFSEILANETVTINYSAQLSTSAPPSESFTNTVTVGYDSAPGANPDQEVYAPVSDSHRVGTSPQLDKTILSTDIAQTGNSQHSPTNPDVNVGELITYQLLITLPEFDNQTVSLIDNLPPGLEFVSSRVSAVGAEISGVTLGDTTLGSASGQLVTFNFGLVSNAFAAGAPDEGVIDAEDQITLDVVVRVANVAAATDGAILTNDARLNVALSDGFVFAEQQDAVSVDVVEPQINITKAVSDPNPDVGDTITYTVVLTNDAAATGPAFNLVIEDALPDDLSLAGSPVLSDPSLGSALSGAGSDRLVISIPVLLPGQSLTVTYDVFVGFTTPALTDVTNTATVSGSTTPNSTLPGGGGRPFTDTDSAIIEANPAPSPQEDRERRLPGGGIDDAQFLPVLQIDPIFSGSAEPGANVTVTLYRQDGGSNFVRNIVADAGGHWIALFPSVELDNVRDDSNDFYNRSVLFDAPYDPLDDISRDSLQRPIEIRSVVTGAVLLDEGYSLSLQQDRPSTLPQDAGLFNARTFFSPAVVGEGYGTDVVLTIDEVFENIAGLTVERLYEASANPLGTAMNRFNYEFLSESTALPGSAR